MFDGGGRHGVAVHPALDVRSESSRCTVKNDPKRPYTGRPVMEDQLTGCASGNFHVPSTTGFRGWYIRTT